MEHLGFEDIDIVYDQTDTSISSHYSDEGFHGLDRLFKKPYQ